LILSIPEEETDWLLGRLRKEGMKEAAVIGHVVGEPKGEIMVELSRNTREK
jgi:hydrogenase maturation factor